MDEFYFFPLVVCPLWTELFYLYFDFMDEKKFKVPTIKD